MEFYVDEKLFREVMDGKKNWILKDDPINAINLKKIYALVKGDEVRVIDQVIDEPEKDLFQARPGYKVEVIKGDNTGKIGWVTAAELHGQ